MNNKTNITFAAGADSSDTSPPVLPLPSELSSRDLRPSEETSSSPPSSVGVGTVATLGIGAPTNLASSGRVVSAGPMTVFALSVGVALRVPDRLKSKTGTFLFFASRIARAVNVLREGVLVFVIAIVIVIAVVVVVMVDVVVVVGFKIVEDGSGAAHR